MSGFQLQAVWFLSGEGLGVPARLSGSHSLVKAAPEQWVKSLVLQPQLPSCSLSLPADGKRAGQLLLCAKVQQGLEGGEGRSVFAVLGAQASEVRETSEIK